MKVAPNCYQCVYFEITHQPRTPRACTRFGIRCKELPSLSVFFATGQHCPYFYPKDDIPVHRPADDGGGWIG